MFRQKFLIFLLALSLNCLAMDTKTLNIESDQVVQAEIDKCVICWQPLESDILDVGCNPNAIHRDCFRDWILRQLKLGDIPRCMLCRAEVEPVDLEPLNLIQEPMEPEASQFYKAVLLRKAILAALNAVSNYADLTPKGKALAAQFYQIITGMNPNECIETFKACSREFSCVKRLKRQNIKLAESLCLFESLKDIGFGRQVESEEFDRDIWLELEPLLENNQAVVKKAPILEVIFCVLMAHCMLAHNTSSMPKFPEIVFESTMLGTYLFLITSMLFAL